MRIVQIGVIGSMADLQYGPQLEEQAAQLGEVIARAGYALIFGAEKDADSLPTVAAVAARQAGGLTIGVTYEKGLKVYRPESACVVVATGLVRGGGRELVQSLSCDGIVAIGGGSGTLNELAVAYQADIPAVVMAASGGWSEKLAGSFLDERKRYAYNVAGNPDEALKMLLKMIKSRQGTL